MLHSSAAARVIYFYTTASQGWMIFGDGTGVGVGWFDIFWGFHWKIIHPWCDDKKESHTVLAVISVTEWKARASCLRRLEGNTRSIELSEATLKLPNSSTGVIIWFDIISYIYIPIFVCLISASDYHHHDGSFLFLIQSDKCKLFYDPANLNFRPKWRKSYSIKVILIYKHIPGDDSYLKSPILAGITHKTLTSP